MEFLLFQLNLCSFLQHPSMSVLFRSNKSCAWFLFSNELVTVCGERQNGPIRFSLKSGIIFSTFLDSKNPLLTDSDWSWHSSHFKYQTSFGINKSAFVCCICVPLGTCVIWIGELHKCNPGVELAWIEEMIDRQTRVLHLHSPTSFWTKITSVKWYQLVIVKCMSRLEKNLVGKNNALPSCTVDWHTNEMVQITHTHGNLSLFFYFVLSHKITDS